MEYGVRYNLYMYILVLAFTCTFEDAFYMYVHTHTVQCMSCA